MRECLILPITPDIVPMLHCGPTAGPVSGSGRMTVDASSLRANGRVCLDERRRGFAIRGRSGDRLAMVQNVAHSRGEALRGEGFLEKGKFELL